MEWKIALFAWKHFFKKVCTRSLIDFWVGLIFITWQTLSPNQSQLFYSIGYCPQTSFFIKITLEKIQRHSVTFGVPVPRKFYLYMEIRTRISRTSAQYAPNLPTFWKYHPVIKVAPKGRTIWWKGKNNRFEKIFLL